MGLIQYIWKWILKASSTPIRIIEIVFLLMTIIALAIHTLRPEWAGTMENLVWQIPLGLLVGVFFISLIVSSYNIYKEQQNKIIDLNQQLEVARKQAYPPVATLMLSPYFKDLDIPLGEFGSTNSLLSGKTFDHCRLHGPIVVAILHDVKMTMSSFSGDSESIFIVTSNKRANGVLGIENCTFVDCYFEKVAFIGSQEQIDQIKKGFSAAKP